MTVWEVIILVQTVTLIAFGVLCWLLFQHIQLIYKRLERLTERLYQLDRRVSSGRDVQPWPLP